jgi:WhiB family transcriptional regulator, redox-sensing transcriptional regulator
MTATCEISPVPDGPDSARPVLPCQHDPDLFFAEAPEDIRLAKMLCAGCPARVACLTEALQRHEPWGVWGGQLFDRGMIIADKRPRGRPRKSADAPPPRSRRASVTAS